MMRTSVSVVLLSIVLAESAAQAEDAASPAPARSPFIVATSGVGYGSATERGSGWGYHTGGRLQMGAGSGRSAGILLDYVAPVGDGRAGRYFAVGIMLEQEIWSTFLATIGTVGYVGLGDTPRSPFGLVSDLGVAHSFGPVRPSLTYHSELIFASPLITVNGVTLGVGVGF